MASPYGNATKAELQYMLYQSRTANYILIHKISCFTELVFLADTQAEKHSVAMEMARYMDMPDEYWKPTMDVQLSLILPALRKNWEAFKVLQQQENRYALEAAIPTEEGATA